MNRGGDFMFIILAMIFCHIFADFNLQGGLANYKQKVWWEKNYPQKLYKFDWIYAMAIHCFSWTFLIMLPVAFYFKFQIDLKFTICFISNIIIHGIVDDLKANRLKINLITDQTLHILQIIITAIILIGV